MNATETKWELVRVINGRPWTRRQIGWFNVTEARDFQEYGEYAADYWTSTVQPGRYPLYAYRDCGRNWHSLGVQIPGVIKSGSWWNKREAGTPTTVCIDLRAYGVAANLLEGKPSAVELLPGIEPRRIDFTTSDGKRCSTHGLFCGQDEF